MKVYVNINVDHLISCKCKCVVLLKRYEQCNTEHMIDSIFVLHQLLRILRLQNKSAETNHQ